MRVRNRLVGSRRVKAKLRKLRYRLIVEQFTCNQASKGISLPSRAFLCHATRSVRAAFSVKGTDCLVAALISLLQTPLEHPVENRREHVVVPVRHKNTRSKVAGSSAELAERMEACFALSAATSACRRSKDRCAVSGGTGTSIAIKDGAV